MMDAVFCLFIEDSGYAGLEGAGRRAAYDGVLWQMGEVLVYETMGGNGGVGWQIGAGHDGGAIAYPTVVGYGDGVVHALDFPGACVKEVVEVGCHNLTIVAESDVIIEGGVGGDEALGAVAQATLFSRAEGGFVSDDEHRVESENGLSAYNPFTIEGEYRTRGGGIVHLLVEAYAYDASPHGTGEAYGAREAVYLYPPEYHDRHLQGLGKGHGGKVYPQRCPPVELEYGFKLHFVGFGVFGCGFWVL